jgi:hypothetical protein
MERLQDVGKNQTLSIHTMKRPISPESYQPEESYTKFIKTEATPTFSCTQTPVCSHLVFSTSDSLVQHRESNHNHRFLPFEIL